MRGRSVRAPGQLGRDSVSDLGPAPIVVDQVCQSDSTDQQLRSSTGVEPGNRARVDRHEADHIRRAVRELTQFEERRQRGRFDRGSLNEAIENLRDLARADQLHPRIRERVASHLRDLYQLRDGSDYRDRPRY